MYKFFTIVILINFLSVCVNIKDNQLSQKSNLQEVKISNESSRTHFNNSLQFNRTPVNKQLDTTLENDIYFSRYIIYQSSVNIQVKNIHYALDTINFIVKNQKGYIEFSNIDDYQATAYIKIRIPVQNFFYVLEEVFKIGRIISHTITAEDVTRKILDIKTRLHTLYQLRNRLYELFKKTQNTEEKAKILKEINRLTTEIETLEAKQKYLKDKVTYSTIEISLSLKQKEEDLLLYDSPFKWIRNLDPLNRSILNRRQFVFSKIMSLEEVFNLIKKPSEFFDNVNNFINKEDLYAFYTSSGTGIRIGIVYNEPRGDVNFWLNALRREFTKRNYDILQKNEKSLKQDSYLHLKIYDGIKQYFYTVGISLKKESIVVIEVFYPNEDDFNKYNMIIKELL